MKITGVGPKIAVPTFLYLLITIYIDKQTKPFFTITHDNYSTLVIIAGILIITGIILVIPAAIKLLKSFDAGILITDGLYGIVRNPMYAAYIVFVIPGICLLFNSWLVLTTVIIIFIVFQIFIKEEYKYLEEKFGEEYKAYLQKVWIKFL